MPKEMIRKYMPGYTKFLDTEFPLGWFFMSASKHNSDDCLFLYFPEVRDFLPNEVLATRVDWVKAVGLKLPKYDQYKIKISDELSIYWLDAEISVQWWEQLLRAFRDGDPDGNGKTDTQPWPATKYFYYDDSWMWGGVRGSFGQTRGPILKDGKFTFAEITENFKEWCKLMQRWYQEKFFSKDDLDRNIESAFRKIAEGEIAASPVSLLHIGRDVAETVPPMSMAKDAEVVVIPPLVGPNGDRGWFTSLELWRKGFYVMKDVDDEKLKRILQIVDYLYFSSDENYVMARYGMPGVHFQWEGESWQSMAIRRAPKEVPKGYAKEGGFGEASFPVLKRDYLHFKVPSFINNIYSLIGREKPIMPYTLPLYNDPEYLTNVVKAKRNIWRLADNFATQAILYGIDIDGEWDLYVSRWKNLGGEKLIELYKTLPITEELFKGNLAYYSD
jgi:putative aldouronate transport system substrate-binding protein